MYKLVGIGGMIRGEEFALENGETIIGRLSDCSVQVDLQGISKRHLKITVHDDKVFAEDLKSANGTFINGKLTARSELKAGDQLAIPSAIFQLVKVREQVIVKESASIGSSGLDQHFLKPKAPAKNIFEKVQNLFRYNLMAIIHRFNADYEWRSLLGFFLFLFVIVTITLTIRPVLVDSQKLVLEEFLNRATHYADEITRINARYLEQNNIEAVNTSFLDQEPGVESYTLFDLDGRIVSPPGLLNTYINDSFSVAAKEWAFGKKNDGRNVFRMSLDDGKIGIAQRIKAYNPKIADSVIVGVIAIKFAPRSLTHVATRNSKAYLEAFITASIIGIFFFGILYYLTIRPIEEIKYELESALRGSKKELECSFLFEEMRPLRQAISSLVQRNRELSDSGDNGFKELEDDTPYVLSFKEILRGVGVAGIVLNSEKKLQAINSDGEDATGIRESASVGQDLLDICREQGFAATLIELCDASANSLGTAQEGSYDLSGIPYRIFANSLLGKDGFAKSFLVTLVRDK